MPGPEFARWLEEQRQMRAGGKPELRTRENRDERFLTTKRKSGEQLEIERLFTPSKLGWNDEGRETSVPTVGGKDFATLRKWLQLEFIS